MFISILLAAYGVLCNSANEQEESHIFPDLIRSNWHDQTDHIYLELVEETIRYDEVFEDKYNYYKWTFNPSQEKIDVTIALTSFTGDPDLYISIGNPDLSKDRYDERSISFGSDSIVLGWENLKTKCKTDCLIYIAVYGHQSSKYSILVSTSKYSPILLSNGVAQNSQMSSKQIAYYYSTIEKTKPLYVSLLSLQGDADLYLRLIDMGKEGELPSEWEKVNQTHHDWSSLSALIEDRIYATPEMINSRCKGEKCAFLAGLLCYGDLCEYQVSYMQIFSQVLLDSQPTQGFIDANRRASYYTFESLDNFISLTISLTLFSGKLAEMDVSFDSPTVANASQWYLNSRDTKPLIINSADKYFKDDKSMKGIFYIGVRCEASCEYSVFATTKINPIVPLLEGQPQSGYILPKTPGYFSFHNTLDTDITFRLSIVAGSAFIVINTCEVNTENYNDCLPTLHSFKWSSLGNYDASFLTVSHSDPLYCQDCIYAIGIFSQGASCSFYINAKNQYYNEIVENGVISKWYLERNQWEYYMFIVEEKSDLEFQASTEYGKIMILVGKKLPITLNNYQWKSTAKENTEIVRIPKNDKENSDGTFYIGILASEVSKFSFVAFAKNSVIYLTGQYIQTFSLEENELKFSFGVDLLDLNIYPLFCSLTTFSDDFKPAVYINFEEQNKVIDFPTQNRAEISYDSDSNYDLIYNSLDFFLPQDKAGRYLFLISSGSHYQPKPYFSFFCTSPYDILELSQNSQHIHRTESDFSPANFYIHIPNLSILNIYIIPCLGDAKLQVSEIYNNFESSLPDLEVINFTSGMILGTIRSAKGGYFLRISSMSNGESSHGNSFQIITETLRPNEKSPKRLKPGKIYYEKEDKKSYRILFEEVKYDDGSTPDVGVEYYLYQSSSSFAHMESVCGMRMAKKATIAQEVLLKDKTQAIIQTSEEAIINVVAVDTRYPESYLSYIPYIPIILPKTQTNYNTSNGSWWFLFVFIAIVIFGILSSIFYYHKKRQARPDNFMELREVNR
ncbi:unnamed protein product [Blepharisma stoltei]|uniref:Uncharacterized protein n=1 Tax=Blepharisma stoltei TaxID=1481888 RepID=A0AAU9IYZ5_9CILI|nr:unnamed protein product [Blepharisma stoltei]